MDFEEQHPLQTRFRKEIDAVRRYLETSLGLKNIEEGENFPRDGVVLRSWEATKEFHLFLSHEFLSDFDVDRIRRGLIKWQVADKIKALPSKHTLFVTTEGTFVEDVEL